MDNIQMEPIKKKYTNILVALLIVVVLLISGSIFLVMWGITSYKDGILLRKEKNRIEQSYGDNRQLVNLEGHIPVEINIIDLNLEYSDEDSDNISVLIEIKNKSKYDDVEVSISKSRLESDRTFVTSENYSYTMLGHGETEIIEYEISRYFDEGDKRDTSIYLDADIYCNSQTNWDDEDYYNKYINLINGVIYWDSEYSITDVKEMQLDKR